MTEAEARAWLRDRFGDPAYSRLTKFVDMLLKASEGQSLIARSTFESVWSRHIADSAQLVLFAPPHGGWLDVGSGGGLPGIVVATLIDSPITLVEPRRKRAEFLSDVARDLSFDNVTVVKGKAQTFAGPAAIITARAVAPLGDVFTWTSNNVSRGTTYLLPRGENAVSDLEIARRAWHGTFHVEQSLTDPAAGIIVASDVRPR